MPPNTNIRVLKEWLLLTVVGEGVAGQSPERGGRGGERAEVAARPVVRVVLSLQTDGERQELLSFGRHSSCVATPEAAATLYLINQDYQAFYRVT